MTSNDSTRQGDVMACRDYRPDHNGECLNCDEWYGEHMGNWFSQQRQAWIAEMLYIYGFINRSWHH